MDVKEPVPHDEEVPRDDVPRDEVPQSEDGVPCNIHYSQEVTLFKKLDCPDIVHTHSVC